MIKKKFLLPFAHQILSLYEDNKKIQNEYLNKIECIINKMMVFLKSVWGKTKSYIKIDKEKKNLMN